MIHAHAAARVYGETKERTRARRLPRCLHEQPTPLGELGEALPCEKCGIAPQPARRACRVGLNRVGLERARHFGAPTPGAEG